MSQDELKQVAQALMDDERLRITGLLAVESLSTSQISERLGLQPEVVSGHLRVLGEISLIAEEQGLYRLDIAALNALSKRLLGDQRPQARQEDFEGDEYDRKVLKDFLYPDGRLRQIPTQYKKLMVILRHLAPLFQPGVRYTEKEVNTILRDVHADYAALRRYMVDGGLLKRESGIYWRTEI